jgi:hypothetical protein
MCFSEGGFEVCPCLVWGVASFPCANVILEHALFVENDERNVDCLGGGQLGCRCSGLFLEAFDGIEDDVDVWSPA